MTERVLVYPARYFGGVVLDTDLLPIEHEFDPFRLRVTDKAAIDDFTNSLGSHPTGPTMPFPGEVLRFREFLAHLPGI
jgi:hypothetical protein